MLYEKRNLGRRWLLSSKMELETKFIPESLDLSDKDDITTETFIIHDIDGWPLLRKLFVIFQNL